ncbi:MAG: FAD-dependent monooxygenase [Burkholderiales bacterium]
MTAVDVAVVGSGLVGAAVALGLARMNCRVALIGAEPLLSSVPPPWDSRIYAISPGSRDLLADLGIWSAMDPMRIQPVRAMEVFGNQGPVRLTFDAMEVGEESLAYIMESSLMAAALSDAVRQHENIALHVPERPCGLVSDERGGVGLLFDDRRLLQARLVVGADGAGSWVRQVSGIDARFHLYPQRAVVANFEVTHGHGDIARQWFRHDGVLALLPLPGRRVSMVWSAEGGLDRELLQLPLEKLAERVEQASGGAVGALSVITPPRAFPLRRMDAAEYVRPGRVLVGDAAHTVHPLAGQGVNLGFRDVRQLIRTLAGRAPSTSVGDIALLRRYARARRGDVASMIAVTEGLQRLFSSRAPAAGFLRNAGLVLAGRLPGVRQQLARQALA